MPYRDPKKEADYHRQYGRDYYRKNIKKMRKYKREQAKRLRAADPEKFRKRSHKFYTNHRKDILAKMAKREQELREKCLELFGSKCAECGFDDKDLIEFHHIIPLKNRRIRRGNYDDILKHPEAYQPFCPNCHKKKTLEDMERKNDLGKKSKMELVDECKCFKFYFPCFYAPQKDCISFSFVDFNLKLKPFQRNAGNISTQVEGTFSSSTKNTWRIANDWAVGYSFLSVSCFRNSINGRIGAKIEEP